jgi:hypothetical protein
MCGTSAAAAAVEAANGKMAKWQTASPPFPFPPLILQNEEKPSEGGGEGKGVFVCVQGVGILCGWAMDGFLPDDEGGGGGTPPLIRLHPPLFSSC